MMGLGCLQWPSQWLAFVPSWKIWQHSKIPQSLEVKSCLPKGVEPDNLFGICGAQGDESWLHRLNVAGALDLSIPTYSNFGIRSRNAGEGFKRVAISREVLAPPVADFLDDFKVLPRAWWLDHVPVCGW